MEKYFSLSLSRRGYCSAYNAIYKKDSNSRVYIVSDGNDIERSAFFNRLTENFRGFNISLFNPFYDDSPDGIFIKNLNTYILSDGGYNRISPVLPGEWEKYISIAPQKNYPSDLRKEILIQKSVENNFYKKACDALRKASEVKERIHEKISPELDDDKLINFLKRFCTRTFRDVSQKGVGTVRLLSSATPLGIHTHWETIFDNCDNIINIIDEAGFVSYVMLGIIKNYAVSEKVPFIMSPAYAIGEIPQFLIFPTLRTAVISEDGAHIPPFSPSRNINAIRFLKSQPDINAFLDIEKRILDSCVMNLYEGRDVRFKYNDMIKEYSDSEKAKISADKLTEKLMN